MNARATNRDCTETAGTKLTASSNAARGQRPDCCLNLQKKVVAFLIRDRLVIRNIRYAPCVVSFRILIASRSLDPQITQWMK